MVDLKRFKKNCLPIVLRNIYGDWLGVGLEWGGGYCFFIVFILGFYLCKPSRVTESELGSKLNVHK